MLQYMLVTFICGADSNRQRRDDVPGECVMPDPVQGRSLIVKGYVGDNKTLLAFDFTSAADADGLAG